MSFLAVITNLQKERGLTVFEGELHEQSIQIMDGCVLQSPTKEDVINRSFAYANVMKLDFVAIQPTVEDRII